MNFFALSTPPGVSGIAVIRVSGESALQIANQITRTVIDQPRSEPEKIDGLSFRSFQEPLVATVARTGLPVRSA